MNKNYFVIITALLSTTVMQPFTINNPIDYCIEQNLNRLEQSSDQLELLEVYDVLAGLYEGKAGWSASSILSPDNCDAYQAAAKCFVSNHVPTSNRPTSLEQAVDYYRSASDAVSNHKLDVDEEDLREVVQAYTLCIEYTTKARDLAQELASNWDGNPVKIGKREFSWELQKSSHSPAPLVEYYDDDLENFVYDYTFHRALLSALQSKNKS